jgi:hypothetical protein
MRAGLGPRANTDALKKRKSSCFCQKSKDDTSDVHLLHSHYTEYAVPACFRREHGVTKLVEFMCIRREFSDCTNSSVGCVKGDLYPDLTKRMLAIRKNSAESWNYIIFYFIT